MPSPEQLAARRKVPMPPPSPPPPRKDMPPELAAALREHSPRLIIDKPTLIRVTESPTGWVLVIPGDPDRDDESKIVTRNGGWK